MEVVVKSVAAITLLVNAVGLILYGKSCKNEDADKMVKAGRVMAVGKIFGGIFAVLLIYRIIELLFA